MNIDCFGLLHQIKYDIIFEIDLPIGENHLETQTTAILYISQAFSTIEIGKRKLIIKIEEI
jgi:hypothetical protein